MKPVSLGLIGAGFHARTVHIPAYDLVGELRFTALASSREETTRAAAERYRVRGFADYRDLLKNADVEAVAVCTPGDLFADVCRAALDAGKHVLLETPGIQAAETGRELQGLARKKNLVVQVGYLNRYNPMFDLVKTRMAAASGPRIAAFEYYPFLTHTYNLALYFCGAAERVISATRDAAGSVATIRFQNGDTAVVVGRSLVNCGMNIESVRVSGKDFYAAVEGRRRLRIIEGMKATGVEEWGVAASEERGFEPHVFAARYLEQSGTAPMLRAFAAAVRGGAEPRSTLADAMETGALMAAIEGKMAGG